MKKNSSVKKFYDEFFKHNPENLTKIIKICFCEFEPVDHKEIKLFFKLTNYTQKEKYVVFLKCLQRASFVDYSYLTPHLSAFEDKNLYEKFFSVAQNLKKDFFEEEKDSFKNSELNLNIEEIFSEKGPLSSEKGYEYREKQNKMALDIEEIIRFEKIGLIEAGCGIGKTFSYLIPAVAASLEKDIKIAVSTNTKTLQNQIYEKDMVFIENLINAKVPSCIVKGRANYLCVRKIVAALSSKPESHAALFLASLFISFYSEKIIDLDDITPPAGVNFEDINASFENCIFYECPYFSNICSLAKLKRKIKTSKIIITNHSFLFSDSLSPYGVMSEVKGIILDEAQAVEKTVIDALKIDVSPFSVKRILTKIISKKSFLKRSALIEKYSTDSLNALDYAVGADNASVLFFDELNNIIREKEESYKIRLDNNELLCEKVISLANNFIKYSKNLLTTIETLKNKLENESDKDDVFNECEKFFLILKELYGNLSFILKFNEEGFVYWIEKNKIIACPIDVSEFCESFFKKQNFAVLISATMTVNGKFDFLKKKLGLLNNNRLAQSVIGEGFNYDKQCRVFINSASYNINSPEYFNNVFKIIDTVVNSTRGGALVLFTSYGSLREIKKNVSRKKYPFNIFFQDKKKSVFQKLKMFKEDKTSVLFGTNSFWEGIDVPGPSLKAIIIVKLPFFNPSDPLVAARLENISLNQESPFKDYMLPGMITRLKQGFGRLIRTKTDKGIVVICDDRLFSKSYSKQVLNNLPCKILKSFTDPKEISENLRDFLC